MSDSIDQSSITQSSQKISSVTGLPKKRHFRQRAHSNPCADHIIDYPISPNDVDWSLLYPFYFKSKTVSTIEDLHDQHNTIGLKNDGHNSAVLKNDGNNSIALKNNEHRTKQVDFLDIGCGYGGLLIKLAELFPENISLGMEIRVKVSQYVQERIKGLRVKSAEQNKTVYQNCACLRTNAMKYLPNYFRKGQLSKMFFLFPDPHFKKQKHKWRIISQQLLGEYAYFLGQDARVYIVTDVKELYDWMYDHFKRFPLFEELDQTEIDQDIIVPHLFESSEEGQKVTRNNGEKFFAIFKRVLKD